MTLTAAPLNDTPNPADVAVLQAPRARWGWRIVGFVTLVGLVGAGWATTRGGDVAWETAPLARGDLVRRVTAVGQLEPVDSVEIGSELNGRVLAVEVDENQDVTAGQVLARLDPTPFALAVTQAEAAAALARANVAKADVDVRRVSGELARTTTLQAQGAATDVALAEAKLAVDGAAAAAAGARASLAQSLASLEKSRQDLDDTVITSPIDGVVLRRLIDPGQTVVSAMSATALFEVASDLDHLKVQVAVDEADVGEVRVGQPATFSVSSWPDRRFDATVTGVDLAADAASTVVVYDTELRVDNADGLLRPGLTTTAEIQVGEAKDVWLIPTLALRFRPAGVDAPAGDHVWTLTQGALVAIPVTVTGSDGPNTAITGEGLTAGMPVVFGGGQ